MPRGASASNSPYTISVAANLAAGVQDNIQKQLNKLKSFDIKVNISDSALSTLRSQIEELKKIELVNLDLSNIAINNDAQALGKKIGAQIGIGLNAELTHAVENSKAVENIVKRIQRDIDVSATAANKIGGLAKTTKQTLEELPDIASKTNKRYTGLATEKVFKDADKVNNTIAIEGNVFGKVAQQIDYHNKLMGKSIASEKTKKQAAEDLAKALGLEAKAFDEVTSATDRHNKGNVKGKNNSSSKSKEKSADKSGTVSSEGFKKYQNLLRQQSKLREQITKASNNLAPSYSEDRLGYYNDTLKQINEQIKIAEVSINSAGGLDSNQEKMLAQLREELGLREQNAKIIQQADYAHRLEGETIAYDKLANKLTTYYDTHQIGISKNTSLMQEYSRLLYALENKQFSSSREAQNAFAQFRLSVRGAGAEVDTFTDKLYKTFGGRLRALIAEFGLFRVASMLRDMVQEVIALDTAMTELRKVTNATEKEYDKFLDGAIDRAKTLGATLTDTVNATASFARLGYNIADASTLADAAIIYKNVGDGISDINDASESIISTMQAFGITVDDIMTIVDKFNAIGNNFATSSGDVGEGIKRSAAAMRAAGNSLDETIALYTAAQTVVQDADVVGTALKTMAMRLRASKTDIIEAGLDADGMATSISSLRKEILAFSGVDIMLDNKTFKSSYQILMELAEVWEDISDIDQANILEKLFGKRQANIGTAILQNSEIAKNALEVSANSAGSALRENEVYLESIQGKLDKFSATYQSFANHFIEDDLIKTVVDGGNVILNILDAIVSRIGTLNTMGLAFGAWQGAHNKGFVRNVDSYEVKYNKKTKTNDFVDTTYKVWGNKNRGAELFRNYEREQLGQAKIDSSKIDNFYKGIRDAFQNGEQDIDAFLNNNGGLTATLHKYLDGASDYAYSEGRNIVDQLNELAEKIKLDPTVADNIPETFKTNSINNAQGNIDLFKKSQFITDSDVKILEEWNQQISLGDTNVDKFLKNLSENNKVSLSPAGEDFLKSVGDRAVSVDFLTNSIKEGSAAQILYNKSLEAANVGNIELAKSYKTAANAALNLGSGNGGFKSLAKSIGASVASMGASLAVTFALSAAFKGLQWVYTNVIKRSETLAKKSDELATEYENAKSELDSLNAELETTQKRIGELEQIKSTRPLSFVEQSELDRLKEYNDELERNKRIGKIELDDKADEMTEGAIDAIGGYSKRREEYVSGVGVVWREIGLDQQIEEKIAALNEAQADLDAAYADGNREKIKDLEEERDSIRTELADLQKNADKEINRIIPGTSEKGDQIVERYTPILNKVDSILSQNVDDLANKKLVELNNAGNELPGFKEEINAVNALAAAGYEFDKSWSGQEDFEKSFPNIVKAAHQAGVGLAEYIDDLNSVKYAQDDVADSTSTLTDIFDSISEKQGVFESVGNEISEYGRISTQTLSSIHNTFPAMDDLIIDYEAGMISAQKFYTELQRLYQKDNLAYKEALAEKQGEDETFWSAILKKNAATFNAIKERYGIDLTLCKNWNEAKASMTDVFNFAVVKNQAAVANVLRKTYGDDSKEYLGYLKIKMGDTATAAKYCAEVWNKYLGTFFSDDGSDTALFVGLKAGSALSRGYPGGENPFQKQIDQVTKAQNAYKGFLREMDGLDSYYNDILNSSFGDYSSSSSSSSKSAAAELPKAYEEALKELKHQRAMEYISEETYYARLDALRKKYIEGVKDYVDENRSLLEEIHSGYQGLFDTEVSDREQWISDRNLFQDWAPDEDPVKEYMRLIAKLHKLLEDGYISREYHTKKLAELQRGLYQAQQEQYNQELDAMQTIIDMTINMLKQENEDMIDALEKQKEIYAEIIAKKKEALELSERELDYQRGVEDKTADLAKLQAQYNALAFDDSRSGQAKRAALAEQIAEKQRELDDYQHEHAVENTQDMLDKQLEGYETAVDEQIKHLEDGVNNQRELIAKALDLIENDSDNLYKRLIAWNDQYGSGLRHDVINPWNTAIDVVKKYIDQCKNVPDIYRFLHQQTDTDYAQRDKNQYYEDASTSSTDTTASKNPAGYPTDQELIKYAQDVKSKLGNNAKLWVTNPDWSSPANVKAGEYVMTAGGIVVKNAAGKGDYVMPLPTTSGRTTKYDLLRYIYDFVKKKNGYATGGVADYTGMAQLHGSKNKVETIFNAEQGKKLFDLVDSNSSMQLIERMYNNLVRKPMMHSPQLSSTLGGISITVEAPVTINGSADATTVAQLGAFGDKLADNITTKITDAFAMRGKGIGSGLNALKSI